MRSDEPRYSARDVITACYAALLHRAPDAEGLTNHAVALTEGTLEGALAGFTGSAEFQAAAGRGPDVALNHLAGMQVETACTDDQRDALWAEVEAAWEGLGAVDPYWSVLTNERYRGRELDEALLDEFYATGAGDVAYLDAFLRRAGLEPPADAVVAEYGCGLGRVTGFLAPRAGSVRAFDISRPHLEAAERRLRGQGVENVEFVHVRDRSALERLEGVDLFFSMIVLQHSPPPVVLEILQAAFRGLRPGGIAFFQVPIYWEDYSFSAEAYLAEGAEGRGMEMHFVPQRAIFALAAAEGLTPVDVRADHCVANYGRWVSHTFLFTKG